MSRRPRNSRPRNLANTLFTGLVAVLLMALGLTSTTPAQAAGESLRAVSGLRGCLETQRQGDILLLLDQSRSLQDNDPNQARADASIYLAARLAQFAQRNNVDLALAVAGFDVTFNPQGGWEDVSDGQAPATTEALKRVATSDGWETDYWSALEGARRYLSERATKDARRCQAIIWFSDGAFDLDVRSTAAERKSFGLTKPYLPGVSLTSQDAVVRAEAAGQRAICRDGGLADQLRAADNHLIAIGLQGTGKAEDFDLMSSVATGAAGSKVCGDIDAASLGSFALVTQIDDLIFIFDDPDESLPCQVQVQRTSGGAGGCQFVIDSAVRRARILAGSQVPSVQVEVGSPAGGAPLAISPGTSGREQLGGVTVAWRPVSATAVEIIAEPEALTAESWTGTWSVGFVAENAPKGSKARANIHLEGDLAPALVNPDSLQWRVGEVIPDMTFGLVHRGTDDAVDPTEVTSDISLNASLRLPDGTSVPLLTGADAAELGQPIAVDLSRAQPGRAELQMQLAVTTAPDASSTTPGTALAPQSVSRAVALLPPLNYPDIPNNFAFGTTEGTGPLTATLPITGAGCVWLDRTTVTTSPEGSEPVSVDSPANSAQTCVRVTDASPGELTLNLTTAEPDNGAIWGTAVVKLAPLDASDAALEKVVNFTAEVRKPVNSGYRLGLAIFLLTLGILGPVVLLYAIARWQARIPATGLLVGLFDLEVREDNVVRRDSPIGTTGLTAQPQEFQFVGVSPPGQRRLHLPVGGLTLQVSTRNPLDPHVLVTPAGPTVWTRDGGNRLPLAVAGNWALLVELGGHLRLLVILPGTVSAQTRDAVLADAQTAINRMLPQLKLPPPPDPDDEWASDADTNWADDHDSADPWAADGAGSGGQGPGRGRRRIATKGRLSRGRDNKGGQRDPSTKAQDSAGASSSGDDDDDW